ncbi:MAG TPA: hypothetical protein VHT75_04340 [Acidimicrobiales bacterium]|nr:hypothetical protein [Acidimicrobiales bacterium]
MIPLATSTITVSRVEAPANTDPYDPGQPAPTTIATGVRAVVSPPTADATLSGGNKVVYAARLRCDPCGVAAGDTVADSTGITWICLWARRVTAVGLDFIEGQLRMVEGAT